MSLIKKGSLVKGKDGNFEDQCDFDEFMVGEVSHISRDGSTTIELVSDEMDRYESGEEFEVDADELELHKLDNEDSLDLAVPSIIKTPSSKKKSLILLGKV